MSGHVHRLKFRIEWLCTPSHNYPSHVTTDLHHLAARGWPALTEVDVDGWTVRLSNGVTQRANSVSPFGNPPNPLVALSKVEQLYRGHNLPAAFHIGPTARPPQLDALLAARGYRFGSPVTIETVDVTTIAAGETGATIASHPSDDWMSLWWSVDGRGDSTALATAHRILTAAPAYYATIRDDTGPAAVGRLAVVGEWGGLYCLAVRPDARRRGLGTAIIRGLLTHDPAIRRCWLQILTTNTAARALYARLGFTSATHYHYRTKR